MKKENKASEIDSDQELTLCNSEGLFFKNIPEKIMTKEEELECAVGIENGDITARDRLIMHNQKLIASIARKYIGMSYSLTYFDLLQAGNLGLLTAANRFDYRVNCKFSTFASFWIKQSISRCIANEGRIIRLPVHITEKEIKMNRAISSFEQCEGRSPTVEEIANVIDLDKDNIEALRIYNQDALSIDTPMGNESDHTIADYIADENTPSIQETIDYTALKKNLAEVFKTTLSERERKVLSLRYGLWGNTPHTLDSIGREMGITRERVRQIEKHAIEKIRKSPQIKKISDYK